MAAPYPRVVDRPEPVRPAATTHSRSKRMIAGSFVSRPARRVTAGWSTMSIAEGMSIAHTAIAVTREADDGRGHRDRLVDAQCGAIEEERTVVMAHDQPAALDGGGRSILRRCRGRQLHGALHREPIGLRIDLRDLPRIAEHTYSLLSRDIASVACPSPKRPLSGKSMQ